MVALSLYRGNLHRVPQLPRRWLMPTPKISLKDFKSLLDRRSKALSLLHSTTTSNPNTNPNLTVIETPIANEQQPQPITTTTTNNPEEVEIKEEGTCQGGPASKEVKDQGGLDCGDCSVKPDSLPGEKPPEVLVEKDGEAVNGEGNLQVEKPDESVNPNAETSGQAKELSDKEKRKKEVEEKLQVLNEKKHNLVQVLKQILNVEEELKRRSSMQGMMARPSIPLQVDFTNDSGSNSRHATPRIGSEANLGGDVEGGEADDVSNHNVHSRHIHRMSSTSPSSESPMRRPSYIQHSVVPHPSRSGLGTTGSPSRFAPIGNPGHPANLPTVSVSGTSYIASSPSPAASGGTSAFRDARHPSPWN